MSNRRDPLYMIGVASRLCGIHPQTLRQYERLGLVIPSRVGQKNRLYSELDIDRVRRIQRLTQEVGVNLAGVEIILRLLEDMEKTREDMETQFEAYRSEVEERIRNLLANSNLPIRKEDQLLPTPKFNWRNPEV
ncbi:MAG: MerR family transcriptional regulator [Fimbriimonadaceae bacterium]|nr:MerR family transcriptional regulator [Fimbriimonadaceae bacterium]